MADPIGTWAFYSNGFPLQLTAYLDESRTVVTGTIVEGNRSSDIQNGTWDDALSKITFQRVVLDSAGNRTGEVQTYVGFLFDKAVQLLNSSTYTPAMAGTFTSTGGYENPVKAAAGWGWFAYYLYGIIQ